MRIKNPEVLAQLEEIRQNRCPDGTLDDVLALLLIDSSLLDAVMEQLVRRGESLTVEVRSPAGNRVIFDSGDVADALDFPRPHGVVEAERRRRPA